MTISLLSKMQGLIVKKKICPYVRFKSAFNIRNSDFIIFLSSTILLGISDGRRAKECDADFNLCFALGFKFSKR